jgi:hypothetical protein
MGIGDWNYVKNSCLTPITLQIQDDQRTFAVDNDSEGHRKLLKHIKTRQKSPGRLRSHWRLRTRPL